MPPDSDPNKRSGRKPSKTQSTSAEGTSWFLGIGINEYQHFPPLRNAVKDVEDVVRVLQDRYDVAPENTLTIFDTEATRRNIIRTLDRLQRKVGPKDKLIVYYSGHGHLNKFSGKGYWIPTNAEQDDTAAYIRNSTIREYVDDIKSLHTLLISDSCFSGALFVRGTQRSSAAIQELANIPSRWALCSGRHDEEVYDGKPGENSPFAESIIDTLRDNRRKEYNVIKLIDRVVEQTRSNYKQMPEGNPLFGVGHKGGQYVFRLRWDEEEAKNDGLSLEEEADWKKATDQHTINAYIKYRGKYPNGHYRAQALAAIEELEEKKAWEIAKRRDSIFHYENYLEKYPNGKYSQEAASARDQLLKEYSDFSDSHKKPVPKKETKRTFKPDVSNKNLDPVIKKLQADMVLVEGDTFTMGWHNKERDGNGYDWEKPAHEVTLDDFYIGRYEVTQAQWRAVMGSDPPELHNKGCDKCPVERVSWNDIQDFLKKLNNLTGENYRLPTEAEWEFAARGGNQTQGYLYSGSNDLDEVGWYRDNSNSKTHPVGQKKANELGLFDMSGNVWEWCQDWYGDYPSTAQQNPKGPESGSNRVLRGGGWDYYPRGCRAAYRGDGGLTVRNGSLGFRLARSSR
jgi:sulfatase modifying factor 1